MTRIFHHDIMPEIKARWSPRAFSSEAISNNDLMAILEAGSFAPSCFNEQPWRFIIAAEKQELSIMQSILTEKNRQWAGKAPVLILLLAKKNFTLNENPNDWHVFDSGTAWGFMSLEAIRRGIISHAMAGFSKEKAIELFNISDEFEPITVIAVGKTGNSTELPPDLREIEAPNSRKSLLELIIRPKNE